MKFIIEHKYLSGWSRWGENSVYDSEAQAEEVISNFLHKAGPGFKREEKRIIPVNTTKEIAK